MKQKHNQRAKRLAGLLLALALAVSLVGETGLPALASTASESTAAETGTAADTASAVDEEETVTLSGGETVTEGGNYRLAADAAGVITIITTDEVSITGNGAEYDDDLQMTSTPNEGLFFAGGTEGIQLTLRDVYISDTSADVPLLDLTGEGNVLTIEGTNVLDMNTGYNLNAAIHVGPGTSLTVNGSGTLYLYKNTQGAGFGGNSGELNGEITFGDDASSLTVFAKGTKQGALIGAGANAGSNTETPGSVTFVEGTYNLISNSRGAVIGGSAGSGGASDGTIVYVGTKVNMNINVDYSGAAVGGGGYDGGNDSSGGTLYVTGGSLRCYIDVNAAGNTTGWNGNAYTAGVNDAAITAQRLNGDGEEVYWSSFNTEMLTALLGEEAESYEVYVDGELFYQGGLPEYGFVQEGLDKGEQLSITSTVSNWYQNGETNLYFYLTGKNHTLTVNDMEFSCIWDSSSKSFTYSAGTVVTHDVTGNFDHVASSGSDMVLDGEDYTAVLTADEYYALPESITVIAGGTELVSGEGYTYDAENGSLTIYAAYIIGDLKITASGVRACYRVSINLSHISSYGDASTAVGADYTAVLSADEYYALPESITVTVGGTELTSGEGYAYDAENGSLVIYAAYITGDISVTAEGVSLVDDLSRDDEGYYLLYTENNVLEFADLIKDASADLDARLMADITVMADSGFAGIGTSSSPYAGTFDGGGHTVTLSMSTDGAAGLFAYVSGATIEGVTTAGTVASSTSTYGCAGLVSYVMSKGVIITDCVNKAAVSGAGYGAGLIGRCAQNSPPVSVTDSSNEGVINCSGDYVGGIAAYIQDNTSFTGCLNYGSVSGSSYVGGIVGCASIANGDSEIVDCGNEGTVTGMNNTVASIYTGGIVGYSSGSASCTLTMNNLYNAGTVTSSSSYSDTSTSYTGGIAGVSYASLSNVYNVGTVNSVNGTVIYTGGIVGHNRLKGAVLSNAYNAGAVTCTSSDITNTGGLLVGCCTGNVMYVDNAYYLRTLDGTASVSGSLYSSSAQTAFTEDEIAAMAKSTAVLQGLAGTLGESFGENYVENYHNGFPILNWEDNGDDPDAVRYGVTFTLANINSGGRTKAGAGADYTAELTADEYYLLPENITVNAGGKELVSGEDYTYDAESGVITIYAASVIGDIEITAMGVATRYSVSTTLNNISSDGASWAAVGTDYTLTLTVANQYFTLPENITVIVDGTELVSGEGYVYNAESGLLIIYAAYITGDIDIRASGVLSIDLTQDEDGYCLLYTEGNILDFAALLEYASPDLDARMMADITVSADTGFAGIGTSSSPYAGMFDGNGYTVTLSMDTEGAAGLFAYVSGAEIEDVVVAGTVGSTVNTYGCAGLVSYVMADGVTIKNCVNKADVTGVGYVGGLVGRTSGSTSSLVEVTVTDCFNEGSIISTGSYAGGIAAYLYSGSVTGCVNSGTVTGTGYTGGIIGYAYSAGSLAVLQCGNEGSVTGSSSYTGGIAGCARKTSSASLKLDSLYNAGTVSGTSYVGGIVGRSYAGFSNVYNVGAVSGAAVSTGGLVGTNFGSGAVLSNAYNAGTVAYTSSDVAYAGGLLVGSITGSGYVMYVDNAYYLSTLDGSAIASGSAYLYSNSTQAALTSDELAAMAKTSEELAALADTLGDSFAANTDADYHQGYPVLAWEIEEDEAEELRIISHPADYTGTAGSTAVFEVEAAGSSLTYQWQYLNAGAVNWKDSGIDGADTAALTVSITEARDGQQYRCVVTDGEGNTVMSDAATLTVSSEAGFSITLQPSDYTGLIGTTAVFTVEADGTGLTYQWQYQSADGTMWHDSGMTGADTATLSVPVTEARDGQQYRCIVTDENGSSVISEAAALRLPSAGSIVITAQPADVSGSVGDTAVFTVEATGNGLTYQWQYLNAGAVNWKNSGMAGADTAALSVPVTEARDGQQYRCVITDEDGNMAVSDAVVLHIN